MRPGSRTGSGTCIALLYLNQGTENTGWVTDALLRGIGNAVPGPRHEEDARVAALGHRDAEARRRSDTRTGGRRQPTPTFAVGRTNKTLTIVQITSLRAFRARACARRSAARMTDRAPARRGRRPLDDRRRSRRVSHLRARDRLARSRARPAAARSCSTRSTPSSRASPSRRSASRAMSRSRRRRRSAPISSARPAPPFALAGFAFGAYLIYVQVALIDALCQWCLTSDGVLALLVPVTILRLRARRLTSTARAGRGGRPAAACAAELGARRHELPAPRAARGRPRR